jgi:threonine/homoserine/homoserine lactone efflux protein
MTLEVFVALVVFATVTSITPGPNNLMLLSSGLSFGFRRSIPHMLGITAGFTALLLAVGAGMGSLLTSLPWLYLAIKIAGGLYLLYLAWRIATSGPIEDDDRAQTKPISLFEAAAFQWVNPKAWVMAVTAMGAYTDPGNYWVSVGLVAAIFGIVNLPNVAVWAGLGVVLKRWLNDPRRLRVFNTGMAVLLVLSLWPLLR